MKTYGGLIGLNKAILHQERRYGSFGSVSGAAQRPPTSSPEEPRASHHCSPTRTLFTQKRRCGWAVDSGPSTLAVLEDVWSSRLTSALKEEENPPAEAMIHSAIIA